MMGHFTSARTHPTSGVIPVRICPMLACYALSGPAEARDESRMGLR
jgi:hypothetical protein